MPRFCGAGRVGLPDNPKQEHQSFRFVSLSTLPDSAAPNREYVFLRHSERFSCPISEGPRIHAENRDAFLRILLYAFAEGRK